MLEKLKPIFSEDDYRKAKEKDNFEKNRSKDVLPSEKFQVLLMTKVKGCNDYVNAVWVNVS